MKDFKPIFPKALSKVERFICEMIWGGVPIDVEYVRQSKMFEEGTKIRSTGIWDKYQSPTIEEMVRRMNTFEQELVFKYTDKSRFEEYKRIPCLTMGMAICYLFNWNEASTHRRLGFLFWQSVVNKYK